MGHTLLQSPEELEEQHNKITNYTKKYFLMKLVIYSCLAAYSYINTDSTFVKVMVCIPCLIGVFNFIMQFFIRFGDFRQDLVRWYIPSIIKIVAIIAFNPIVYMSFKSKDPVVL